MAEDNKNEKQENELTEEERPRGDRGIVGEPTAALTLKQRYHEAHFQRVDAEDKHNPTKRRWVKNPGAPSLKQFARELLASGDATAKEWFAHKRGSLNASRSDANLKAAREAASATKTAKRKKGQGK